MKILQKDIKSNKVKYKILSSEKIWTDQQEIVRKSLAKKIKVPGFRVGHVPVDIARKQISEYEVINGALKKAVDKNYDDLVNDKDFDSDQVIEDSVSIELGKVDAQNLEVTFIFDKFPEVTIEDYKKIKINYVQPEIKKSEIEHQINRYLAKDTMLIPKNADVISEGDMVNFDFKGFVDDKPFDGGESKGYELKIGSNSFIPGFEKQMIGLKKGEKKTIDIIFPNDYHTENLRGKKAKFELNINDIKTIKQPVLDEAYISKFAIHNVKNEAQFKKYITNQLMEQKEYFEKQKAIKKISAWLIDHTKLSYVPKSLLDLETKRLNEDVEKKAVSSKITKGEYISKRLGYKDHAAFEHELKKTAEKNLRLVVAIQKIIDDLKIEVSEKDLQAHFEKLAKVYGTSVDAIKQRLNNNFEGVETFILQEKTFDKLIELNK